MLLNGALEQIFLCALAGAIELNLVDTPPV